MADRHFFVRPIRPDDIDDLVNIENTCFGVPWSKEVLQADMQHNNVSVYVGVQDENGNLAGYGSMWLIIDEAHINNIAVLPQYRRHGVAKKLIAALIEVAKQRHAPRLTLEVRESNSGAIALYESCGFVVEGRRPGYYADNGEDALIMWLGGYVGVD